MIEGAGISRSRAGFRCWTLSFQARGENIKTVGTRAVLRRPPYVALTRPATPYRVATTPRGREYLEYWVVFVPRPEWMRLLDWPEDPPGAVHVRLRPPAPTAAIRRAFEDLLAARHAVMPERDALAENALERILLLMQSLHAARAERVTDARVQRAVDWLNAHVREPLTLGALAARACVSPSRLSHLFVETVGLSPLRYRERCRIETAKALLLSTNDPVRAIADQVGYANPYHFSTRFRRRVGRSPRAFRNRSLGAGPAAIAVTGHRAPGPAARQRSTSSAGRSRSA